MNITWIGSPNYWPGRTQAIREIELHWMVGTLRSTDATFQSIVGATSAHYGIEDYTTHQYVDEADRAWHSLQANHWTIGIEHSAGPGRPASDATYATSIALCADICRRYNLNPDTAIVPHHKYVNTQCCGSIDIDRIKAGVKALLKEEEVSKPTYQQVLDQFRTFTGSDPTETQMNYYVARDWGTLNGDLLQFVYDRKKEQLGISTSLSAELQQASERLAQMTVQVEELKKDPANSDLAKALQARLEQTNAQLEQLNKENAELLQQKQEGMNWLQKLAFALSQLFSKK